MEDALGLADGVSGREGGSKLVVFAHGHDATAAWVASIAPMASVLEVKADPPVAEENQTPVAPSSCA
jgi:hypothetical protein